MNVREVKGWPVRKADKLTTSCDLIVWKYGSLNLPQPYGPPRPATGIELPNMYGMFHPSF
jgi:hypothetical protein